MKKLLVLFLLSTTPAMAANPCERWVFKGFTDEALQTTLGTYGTYAAAMSRKDHIRALSAMERVYWEARDNPSSTAMALCLSGEDPSAFVTAAKQLVAARTVRAPVAQRPLTCLKMDSDLTICN